MFSRPLSYRYFAMVSSTYVIFQSILLIYPSHRYAFKCYSSPCSSSIFSLHSFLFIHPSHMADSSSPMWYNFFISFQIASFSSTYTVLLSLNWICCYCISEVIVFVLSLTFISSPSFNGSFDLVLSSEVIESLSSCHVLCYNVYGRFIMFQLFSFLIRSLLLYHKFCAEIIISINSFYSNIHIWLHYINLPLFAP